MRTLKNVQRLATILAVFACLHGGYAQTDAQRTLPLMPRFDKYKKLQDNFSKLFPRVEFTRFRFSEDGKTLYYRDGETDMKVDVATGEKSTGKPPAAKSNSPQRRAPDRGRQFAETFSADGKLKAVSRDRNVYVSDAKGDNEIPITTDGSASTRIKYGTGSWVYGEELDQREAMWFSSDSKYLAYYRFDESRVPDYYLTYDLLKDQDTLNTEAFPLVGKPNPVADVFIYNLATHQQVQVDTKFGDPALSEYVFAISWTADGKELTYHRMNRAQTVMEYCAADPTTGKSRVIIREERTTGWVEQNPAQQFLKDGKEFIWMSDRNGFNNLYLYNLDGKLIRPLTQLSVEVNRIVTVDEVASKVYYLAADGDNPYLLQLHSVHLDGTHDTVLTDKSLNHGITPAPQGGAFVDVEQNIDTPPTAVLRDGNGKRIAELLTTDMTAFNEMNLKKAERFTVKSADGKWTLYGRLQFPSDFDPTKKYPMLVNMYGGPLPTYYQESFVLPSTVCELGFITMSVECRQTGGRGRDFLISNYKSFGIHEIDDCANAVKQLCAERKYIDPKRVGIQGTSYGGYFSAISILRYPDVYRAACSSSPVTDFRLYDSVYTERYMGLATEGDNKAGYDAASCMTYAKNLKGYLMLYFGTADNNVHPSNTIRLANALEDEGKRFDMQVGADRGHSQMNDYRMWEYFVQHLILDFPDTDPMAEIWRDRKLDQELAQFSKIAKQKQAAKRAKKSLAS